MNVEAVSASTAAAGVTINLSQQSEGFAITGSAQADNITGGAGNDTIVGGAGIDTVNYATTLAASNVSYNAGPGTWSVSAWCGGHRQPERG